MKNNIDCITWVSAHKYYLFDLSIRSLERMQLIYEEDLNNFLTDLFKSVLEDLNIPYKEEMDKIFEKKNIKFYDKKKEFYKTHDLLSVYSSDYDTLFSLLRLPKVNNLTVIQKFYDSLSKEEKEEFKKNIQ